ncbi:MAG TPA: type III polyketide synthase [Phycisphaerales bacterium]|nr:type III polyketide synthase [Phycisphaerales bacterium]
MSQQEVGARLAKLWRLEGPDVLRWQRMVDGCGVEHRCACAQPEDVITRTTAERMRMYEHFAPDLAVEAARSALDRAGVSAQNVTDVLLVSCTGFSAPGIEVDVIQRLALRDSVRRCTIGFMGCFGAITGLRQACALTAADPRACVLLICVELCSLHFRADCALDNQVACALFADGAAATILCGDDFHAHEPLNHLVRNGSVHNVARRSSALARVDLGCSKLLLEGKDWMSWQVSDQGFVMNLSREVPIALRNAIADFVRNAQSNGMKFSTQSRDPLRTFIVHPGGSAILDAVNAGLDLKNKAGIDCAREILRERGNMSSCTVLHVLERALMKGEKLPALMIAFGPGLTLESVNLHPDE